MPHAVSLAHRALTFATALLLILSVVRAAAEPGPSFGKAETGLSFTNAELITIAERTAGHCAKQHPGAPWGGFDAIQCECFGRQFASRLPGGSPELLKQGSDAQLEAMFAATADCKVPAVAKKIAEASFPAQISSVAPEKADDEMAAVTGEYGDLAKVCAQGGARYGVPYYGLLDCDCVLAQQDTLKKAIGAGPYRSADLPVSASDAYVKAGCFDRERARQSLAGEGCGAGMAPEVCGCMADGYIAEFEQTQNRFLLEVGNVSSALRAKLRGACVRDQQLAEKAQAAPSRWPEGFLVTLSYRCASSRPENPQQNPKVLTDCRCFANAWLDENPPEDGIANNVFDAAVRDEAEFTRLTANCP